MLKFSSVYLGFTLNLVHGSPQFYNFLFTKCELSAENTQRLPTPFRAVSLHTQLSRGNASRRCNCVGA